MSRWTAAAGVLVVSLDSMMNIAFPAIATAFAAPAERVRWIIICYVLTYAITSFAGGAAADRLGHVAVFRTGVALSVVAFVMGRAGALDRPRGHRASRQTVGVLEWGDCAGWGPRSTRGRAAGRGLRLALGLPRPGA